MIDSVKGLSKKDINKQLAEMKKDVGSQLANSAEKLRHADDQLLQLAQKFDKFEDDHRNEFSDIQNKVRNIQRLEYQICRQI